MPRDEAERLAMSCCNRVVVKIGGSLLSQPDLGARLEAFLKSHYPDTQVCLIVGGGGVIDALRELDQIHAFDAAKMHWICIRALRTTFEVLSLLLPTARRIHSMENWERLKHSCEPGLHLIAVDAFYSEQDHRLLPCNWNTTSDSLAALLAQRLDIQTLCLLKSCDIPATLSLSQAGEMGYVDPSLAAFADRLQITFARLPSNS